jgi:hypothetical protein
MLEASFDAQRNRGASISGAYQYDTGQRIRMHGLPTPDELAQRDDFLSGDIVAVQAQFGYKGDSQSEPRVAQYDEENDCWVADIPDAYLTRAEPVFVYVYVMYGADETHSRSKTMYTGSFTPIARPAPSTAVTPDQMNAWDALVGEVNLTLSEMNTAISNANAAAVSANEGAAQARSAAQAASSAAAAANTQADAWRKATASAQTLTPGSSATVTMTKNNQGGHHITYGIPRGEKGEKGDTGPAGVTFRLDGTTLYIDTV